MLNNLSSWAIQWLFLILTASLHMDGLNDNCKESSYIAGLSFLVVMIIILVAIILVFIR